MRSFRIVRSPAIAAAPPFFLPGSGFGFWKQFGQLHAIFGGKPPPAEARFVGVSAGSLSAALYCSGVSYQDALDAAREVMPPSDKISLLSGPSIPQIVAKWLDAVLPADASTRCSGVYVATASFPFLQQRLLHDFSRREDLIDVLCASVSLPLLSYPCWLNETSGVDQHPKASFHFDACTYNPHFQHVLIDPQVSIQEMAGCTEEAATELFQCGLEQPSITAALLSLEYEDAEHAHSGMPHVHGR
jgi:hypothetical protein